MYILLYNPLSKNNRGITSLNEVIEIIKGHEYLVYSVLDDNGFCEKLTELNSKDTLIVIGGDGTLSKFANSEYQTNAKVLFYAGGTGNDFVRHMQKKGDNKLIPYESVDKIIFETDTFKHSIINSVGIGVDGYVINLYNQSKKFSKLKYIKCALKAFILYKPQTIKLEIDGEKFEFENAYLVSINNTKYVGNGMMISPKAECDDGLLDVMVLHSINTLKLLFHFPKVFKGTHMGLKYVFHKTGKKISCVSNKETYLQYDGEALSEKIKSFVAYVK